MGFVINHFSNMVALSQAAMIVLYALCTSFTGNISVATDLSVDTGSINTVTTSLLLVLVAFGLSALASTKFSLSTLGYTLLYVVFAIQLTPLWQGFWVNGRATRLNEDHFWAPVALSMSMLQYAVQVAFGALISWGAVAGRMSAGQGFAATFFMIPFLTANYMIGQELQVLQNCIYLFSAAWGLGMALTFKGASKPLNFLAGRGDSTVLATLGALFFVIAFPIMNSSSVAANIYQGLPAAANPLTAGSFATAVAAAVARSQYNTLYAILSGVMVAYMLSANLNNGKFSLQAVAASIVGAAVSISGNAAAVKNPYGAMLQGTFVAIITTLALHYNWAGKCKLNDSLQVFAQYLLPAVLGVAAAAITSARVLADQDFGSITRQTLLFAGRSAITQGGFEFAFGVISVVLALIFGAVFGYILRAGIFVTKTVESLEDSNEWLETEGAATAGDALPETAATDIPAAAAAPKTEIRAADPAVPA